MKNLILFVSLTLIGTSAFSQSQAPETKKLKFLIHITQGSENPTRAALAFLVAKSAIEEGHTVTLFLAGDGVQLFRKEVIENLAGLGTGKLSDHLDAIIKGGGKFYLSGMSSKARGITEEHLKDKSAEFAMPNVLVRLAADSDRIFVY
jgi:predicted peroxiredoxin